MRETPYSPTTKIKYFTLLCLITLLLVSQPVQAEAPKEIESPNKVLGIKIALAIKTVETGGKFHLKGGSGERGAYQILPSTWKALSKKHLGTSTAMTVNLEEKVVLQEIIWLLEKGYTPKQIALIWNSGQSKKCSRGVNRHGVKYDSCAYVDKVIGQLNKML